MVKVQSEVVETLCDFCKKIANDHCHACGCDLCAHCKALLVLVKPTVCTEVYNVPFFNKEDQWDLEKQILKDPNAGERHNITLCPLHYQEMWNTLRLKLSAFIEANHGGYVRS